MADLEHLADACRAGGMSVCLDFVMNHTSEDHEWAKKARAGEPGYRERYFFYDSWDIPREFEKTVPQVFPTTAPGSFTQLEGGQIVMTNFYPYQWDLNYANPAVFNDMTKNMLFLANRGVDIIRLDAIPYIWKELGTDCRNLPQVHTLSRMLRMACEIVCPSVLLLGEVVMEPSKVAPYFGTPDKPECHMLYNVTTMATTWHTLATGDVSLLKRQMEAVCALPKDFFFLNYLRCHDDIGWGLDYAWLGQRFGTNEVAHKKYLNDYFTGKWPGSGSRGVLYNDDPRLGDARLCGTRWGSSTTGAIWTTRKNGRTAAISTGAASSGSWRSCVTTRIPARASSSSSCGVWRRSGPRSPALTQGRTCGWRTAAAGMCWPCAAGWRAGSWCACSTSAGNSSPPAYSGRGAIPS